jgi:sugar transferase (PEP-CTERM system associated)
MLLIGMAEYFIAFSSLYVAGLLIFGSVEASEAIVGPILPQAFAIGVVILLSLVAVGLYQFNLRTYFHQAVLRIVVGVIGGTLALALILKLFFPALGVSYPAATVAVGYIVISLSIVRFVFCRTVDGNVFRRRTLVYGAGVRASAIADLRRAADRRGFMLVGRVAVPGDDVSDHSNLVDGNKRTLTMLAIEHHADEIVIAADERRGTLPVRDLLDAKLAGIDVVDLSEFLERETGKIRVDLLKPGWLVFSDGFRTGRFRTAAKRLLDVVASTFLILLFAPVMLAVAIAIKWEEGLAAPLLYYQTRVGRGGRMFRVRKFRSMSVNAEADGTARWASKQDDRVTQVGRFIRQYRLDELPQLFNILRGNMSLIGPRPERPEFVQDLQKVIPYYSVRHTVKPGLTGWAQLRYTYGATEEDALEKLQYELYYIKNHSLLLDILILLQTVEVVLWGKGAR